MILTPTDSAPQSRSSTGARYTVFWLKYLIPYRGVISTPLQNKTLFCLRWVGVNRASASPVSLRSQAFALILTCREKNGGMEGL